VDDLLDYGLANYARVCVCARARLCVRACVRVCVCEHACICFSARSICLFHMDDEPICNAL
jgi:hypothetical protein